MQAHFPEVPVTLVNHPPPPINVFLSRIVGAVQFAGLAVTIAGDSIFPVLGYSQSPPWYTGIQQNKLGYAAGIWIVGNMMHNMLLSTGAFEVSCNGQLIFSKLAENRMPSTDEIVDGIQLALHANDQK